MEIFIYILKLIYLMLPAGFANMAPIFFKNKYKFLAKPVDLGLKFRGKRILGDHKTLRGYFTGMVLAIIVIYLQKYLMDFSFFRKISIIDYYNINLLLLGFLMGFGALFGDSVKSFIKRQLNIEPGKPFVPWDQIDYSIGAIVFLSFIYKFEFIDMISIIIIFFLLHLLIRNIGFFLKINKERW